MKPLTIADQGKVTDLVCDLCTEHMYIAFMDGVRVGYSLFEELWRKDLP